MKKWEIFQAFEDEYVLAIGKHPEWPADAIHASAILSEEAGELTQAALDFHYGPGTDEGAREHMRAEAIQCGAMALRFLMYLDAYRRPEPTESTIKQ